LRRYESLGKKFPVGENGNRSSKYVEASSGTNLFFAVYESTKSDKKTNEEKKSRSFVTVPLNIIMECQKENGKLWKEKIDNVLKSKKEYKERIEQDSTLLFLLSPNDLVYLPESEQAVNGISSINRGRIYKMVSSSGSQCFFIKNNVANSIVDKCEFSALNKMERAITGEMIKETCIPINVNRLGKIELVAYDRH
jgi:CRISPR-associated endonuclease Csn1